MKETQTALPHPTRDDRWQPMRSGLLNLYRYTRQEFWFEHGHLLLRGNNGTGKSRVLALQLPFLLDGEIGSHRVEPDADPAKRMEWNVLMDMHENRTGYTWIEFARRHDDAHAFVTLGCGLRATKGAALKRWFFVTSQRIGQDLFLETDAGTPLTQDALNEALAERGQIYTTVGDYRRAVDERLFQLGEERYLALIELLIQLRQPQLSRQLDERKLSAALSNSLPPLDATVLQEVAESFRSLEEDRRSLENYESAVAAVASFRDVYRRYARMVCGLHSEALRNAHSRYEKEQRDVREADITLAEAAERQTEAAAQTRARDLDAERLAAEQDALRASPEMRQAEQIDRLDRDRRAAEERLNRAQAEHDEQAAQCKQRTEAAAEAAAHAGRTAEDAETATRAARAAAHAVAADRAHRFQQIIEESASPEDARERVEKLVTQLDDAVRHLRGMQHHVRDAQAAVERAADREQQQHERFDTARAAEATSVEQRRDAVDAYLQAVAAWTRSLVQLALPDVDDLLERTVAWVEALDAAAPPDAAAQTALDAGTRRVERRRREGEAARSDLAAQDAALETEQAELTAGTDRFPSPPPTRDPEARAGRPGAPLWRVCDFHPNVPPGDRAMLEAALQAAGLLDAWVTPDGNLRDTPDGDALLTLDASPCDQAHALGRVLHVTIDSGDPGAAALDTDRIEAVLARISTHPGAHHTVVSTDGRWKHGLLAGRWQKDTAEYIGAAAREQARRRRLEAIAGERAELARRDTIHQRELAELETTDAALHTEFEARPSAQPVRDADRDVRHAQAAVAGEREALLKLTEHLYACRTALQAKETEYRQTAQDLHLADWMNDLDGLARAVRAFADGLAELWLALERSRHARERGEQTAAELAQAEQRLALCKRAASDAEVEMTRRQQEYETLCAVAGQAAADVKARLDDVQQRLRDARRVLEEARAAEQGARETYIRLEERRDTARQRLAEAETQRVAAHETFQRFVSTRIVEEADLDLADLPDPERAAELAVNPAVEFARAIDRELTDARWDDDTRDRIQNELLRRFQDLQSTLTAHEYAPMSETHHDITIVTCPYQGQPRTMRELRRCLDDEVTQRRQLLAANERRFIENYLIGEVAHHLHHRIREADRLVADMNAELQARPMSTGMQLRFVWTPRTDGPAGLVEARELLAQAQEILSADDRDMLASFLQERIREVREEGETASWRDTLEQAVDYRLWHMFGIERRQGGRWTRLTRRTHGTGSGGEKAIALTIPQFAAAAAHYHHIPHAPRLIMLDEAFVGIDSDMRGKCMDLLHQFDLDFVMTSEREWGCYPTVRGLAIYQLATRPGIDAIAVTRWVWNGREKKQRDTPPPAQPTKATMDASEQTELFAGDDG